MSDKEMLSIGNCRSCKAGPLGLRKCGQCNRVVLLCDECDAAYSSYGEESITSYATENAMPCPLCEASLWSDTSRWASLIDLQQEEALQKLIKEGEVEVSRGKAFSRRSFED